MVFLLATIPVTTYVVIRSEQTSRGPQAATVCEKDCVAEETLSQQVQIDADFNDDGLVDSKDLAILVTAVGKKGDHVADLNKNKIVDEADLVIFQTKWTVTTK